MYINLLSEEIINQIAAGEVIENPAAVIKELVENSLDANATRIEVDLDNGGLDRIVVKDNGEGMSKEDLEKAPLRHATSKITSFSDLYSIDTMGFRGEALASMFSVSKAKIISKQVHADKAFELDNKNGEVKETARETGTTVEIDDLFCNTPARKKYLGTANRELRKILEVYERFQIYYNDVEFRLKHNGKLLVNKPVFQEFKDNLYYVFGRELRGNLLYLEEERKGIKVKGYVGNPSTLSYSYRKYQKIYVNSRYVKSKLISDAVYEGFGSNLMVGKHPFFVLFLEIDPEIVDVNVHPTKIEIRFENEVEIYDLIRNSVEKVFETKETFKSLEEDKDLSEVVEDVSTNQSENRKENKRDESVSYFTSHVQKSLDGAISDNAEDSSVKNISKLEQESISSRGTNSSKESYQGPIKEEEKTPLQETLSDYRILGQLNKTYIVVETPDEMLLVDQHVAEEKYYYEKFKQEIENHTKVSSQKLLKPEIVNLTSSEMELYRENASLMHSVGFETEEFGEREVVVRAVPVNVRSEIKQASNLKDMLHNVLVDSRIRVVEEEKYSKVASMACRISVMAGDELTMPQMKRMIENLKGLKQPFNCPHGRPTFLKYSFKELERKFKRVL